MRKKIKKFSGTEGSYVLPAQVRTFVDTVSGDESPITEKNFNPSELQQMRDAIMRSRERQEKQFLMKDPNSKEFRTISAVKAGKRPYDKSVDYGDYGDDAVRQKTTLRDYSPLPGDAARNTLGRFSYEKTPEGRLIAKDSYDFKDDLVKENPNIPRSKEYEGLSALQKVGKLAADSFDPKMGMFSTLPSRVGSAFVGAKSRPVRVDLGEAPFKKGGKVKAAPKAAPKKPTRSSTSKRGDGIATKGFTKGKMR